MPTASRAFPAKPEGVRHARRWVTELLEGWALSCAVRDDGALLTSELATNAVVHARTSFEVTVIERPGVVRVTVSDDDPALPSPREAGRTDNGGRGLRLVQEVSSAWGAESVPGDGKVVWFELCS